MSINEAYDSKKLLKILIAFAKQVHLPLITRQPKGKTFTYKQKSDANH